MGLCGGYQMLGKTIADPDGIEGAPGTSEGLGLLDVDTVLEPMKSLQVIAGNAQALGADIRGYHMHMGVTSGPDTAHPFATVAGQPEGATRGNVIGTYMHGIFASDVFRHAFLHGIADLTLNYETGVDATLDALADHLERHLDLDQLLKLARES